MWLLLGLLLCLWLACLVTGTWIDVVPAGFLGGQDCLLNVVEGVWSQVTGLLEVNSHIHI